MRCVINLLKGSKRITKVTVAARKHITNLNLPYTSRPLTSKNVRGVLVDPHRDTSPGVIGEGDE